MALKCFCCLVLILKLSECSIAQSISAGAFLLQGGTFLYQLDILEDWSLKLEIEMLILYKRKLLFPLVRHCLATVVVFCWSGGAKVFFEGRLLPALAFWLLGFNAFQVIWPSSYPGSLTLLSPPSLTPIFSLLPIPSLLVGCLANPQLACLGHLLDRPSQDGLVKSSLDWRVSQAELLVFGNVVGGEL